MLPAEYFILDLETTGLSPARARIIEVGVLEIRNGEWVEEWSSLVNPETPISPFITQHTGISNAMVADAPTFAEIAEELQRRLQDKLLIAHNARFDYGFLKTEFRRLGLDYQAKTFCTLRLSRRLYPKQRRHGLDSLIARHQLTIHQRHRALGDAQMTWQFLEMVLKNFPEETLEPVINDLLGRPSLPPHLPPEQLDAIPHAPGVYLFYGKNDELLYVGKSVNLRSRVLSHFSGDHAGHKGMRLSQQLYRIDFIDTAGELGALLLEARLIKSRHPIHNRRLWRTHDLFSIRLADHPKGQAEIIAHSNMTSDQTDQTSALYGLFRSKKQAMETLRQIAAEQQLCLQAVGLEKGRGACFAYQLKKCRGACVGKEPLAIHRLRLQTVLAHLKMRSWPFAGPIAVRESSAIGKTEIQVFDQWRHLGTATDDNQLEEILDFKASALPFDLDSYKILCRFMKKRNRKVEVLSRASI